MRKYTLYQAAKYSKISRYKLEQAIQEKLLKVIEGKGNIKLFIYEDELDRFLNEHGDQFSTPKFEDDSRMYIHPEISNFVSKDIYEKMLQEKERIILLLEDQNKKFLPLIAQSDNQLSRQRIKQLEDLLAEAIDAISSGAKKDVLKTKLSTISFH